MTIHRILISQTASGGSWSFNSVKFNAVMLKQIIVEAATSTTTFNFTLTDEEGDTIYTTEQAATGKLRVETEIPLKGIYTLAVADASTDEAFTGKLMAKE